MRKASCVLAAMVLMSPVSVMAAKPPPPPPPPPITPPGVGNTFYLDFNGNTANGFGSSYPGTIVSPDSGVNVATQFEAASLLRTIYAPWNATFVVGERSDKTYTIGSTYHVVITLDTFSGMVTSGLTYIGGYFTGTGGSLSYVFLNAVGSAALTIAQCVAHEVGHSLRLQHQSTWVNNVKTNEYAPGPIMGNSLGYPITEPHWIVGRNSLGVIQDDAAVLTSSLGLAPVVPEPTTIFVGVFAVLLSRVRRRRL